MDNILRVLVLQTDELYRYRVQIILKTERLLSQSIVVLLKKNFPIISSL